MLLICSSLCIFRLDISVTCHFNGTARLRYVSEFTKERYDLNANRYLNLLPKWSKAVYHLGMCLSFMLLFISKNIYICFYCVFSSCSFLHMASQFFFVLFIETNCNRKIIQKIEIKNVLEIRCNFQIKICLIFIWLIFTRDCLWELFFQRYFFFFVIF